MLADQLRRYLLIDYHLGDLYTRTSYADRRTALQKARTAYERFLNLISNYEILSSSAKKMYEAYSENPTTFSTISTTDFTARRAAKIANFKQEKDLKQKIDVCSQHKYLLVTSIVGLTTLLVPLPQPRLPLPRRRRNPRPSPRPPRLRHPQHLPSPRIPKPRTRRARL